MTDTQDKKPAFQLAVGLPDKTVSRPKPVAANWFHVSRLERDFQLMVGYVDLQQVGDIARIAKETGSGGVNVLEADLTHRFLVSWRGFFQLRAEIEDIVSKLRAQGVEISDDEIPPPKALRNKEK